MSDVQSQISSATRKSSGHRIKICAYDGKPEGKNYASHAKVHHDGVPKEWVAGEPLLEEPWCENWDDVIFRKADPVGIRAQFKKGGTGMHSSKKGSVSGSVASNSQFGDGDAHMESVIQEESKSHVAVP